MRKKLFKVRRLRCSSLHVRSGRSLSMLSVLTKINSKKTLIVNIVCLFSLKVSGFYERVQPILIFGTSAFRSILYNCVALVFVDVFTLSYYYCTLPFVCNLVKTFDQKKMNRRIMSKVIAL